MREYVVHIDPECQSRTKGSDWERPDGPDLSWREGSYNCLETENPKKGCIRWSTEHVALLLHCVKLEGDLEWATNNTREVLLFR